MELLGLIIEFLILIAVVAEGWISWRHYTYALTKKERAKAKRKATKLIKGLYR